MLAPAGALPSLSDFTDMDYTASGDVFMVSLLNLPHDASESVSLSNASARGADAPVTLFADPQSPSVARCALRCAAISARWQRSSPPPMPRRRLPSFRRGQFDGEAWLPRRILHFR